MWTTHPSLDDAPALTVITDVLDPVLERLGFGPGSIANDASGGQVTFCRGNWDDDDECVDLVIDVEANPSWVIVDVRYWGFSSDRWHLAFRRDVALEAQVRELASTLPGQLGSTAGS
ncbi:MAG: hypothetical protein AAFP84_01180 [Actinomycetota bacterium]